MSLIKDTFAPKSAYNGLPHIRDVSSVPETHASDLADLRALLSKHKVPEGVCIRLIHKHYEVEDGEVMAFEKVAVPECGEVTVMHPMKNPDTTLLRGIHFYVDETGELQAYEYAMADVPDLEKDYGPFLAEFAQIIVERGLQMKFGLKVQGAVDKTSWTEFEFPNKRSTIMVPEGLPTPEGDYDFDVITEWGASQTQLEGWCTGHARCRHCRHRASWGGVDNEVYLGAQKVEVGSPVWGVVNAVAAIC